MHVVAATTLVSIVLAAAKSAPSGFWAINKAVILTTILGVVLGILGGELVRVARTRVEFRRQMRENDHVSVAGTWFAAWQTSVDGSVLLNTEELALKQRGNKVRMRNVEVS